MMKKNEVSAISVLLTDSLYQVIKCIDQSARLGISLVVNEKNQLITTLTDGDIRRAVLAGYSLDNMVKDILPMKENSPHPTPVTAPHGTTHQALLTIMREQAVRQIPVLDRVGAVEDIVFINDLTTRLELPIAALIMAGGAGKRLRPLTEETPKPMLSLGGRPLLERIIKQLHDAGIQEINISTHYKAEKITEYFGDGSKYGAHINYYHETHPMGTGGVLGLMPVPVTPLLIMNGDILTEIDFRDMVEHHHEGKSMMTMAVRLYGFQVPYGVVKCEGDTVQDVVEKPKFSYLVNAGIYLIEPAVFRYIPRGKRFNMTNLIHWLLQANEKVNSYPIFEYWLDIGKHADYQKAQKDVNKRILEDELEK